ncbi:hypothetical protein AZF37_07995 [endosymbiont 'TC1' of Trimyema compressum]|uniref:hypothetical protein n=1 Tax=endosymbiont 'TC1' of Trimyema compressum TaxID=243899 RepID=UPI0007F184F9|nr:hypothetical protein [endosymbiont 'TC1' of Trimyema compressum]AMP21105.1 hypothetical protein AZF37_07995 [endosymbiont 'TC1' of Trimyema compressum]
MKAVLVNNFVPKKQGILLLLIFTAAIFTSNMPASKWNVAIISTDSIRINEDAVNITRVETSPPFSDLILGRYDAIISINESREYTIESIKNKETARKIVDALEKGERAPSIFGERGVGTNILGFLILFLLFIWRNGNRLICR